VRFFKIADAIKPPRAEPIRVATTPVNGITKIFKAAVEPPHPFIRPRQLMIGSTAESVAAPVARPFARKSPEAEPLVEGKNLEDAHKPPERKGRKVSAKRY